VDWPFIHWIAVVVWEVISLDVLLCLGFTLVALRGQMLINWDWPGWGASAGALVTMLVFAIVLVSLVPGEFTTRASGAKGICMCCSYQFFLFAAIQPAIYLVILTIIYAVTSAPTINTAMANQQLFMMLAGGAEFSFGTSGSELFVNQLVWDEAERALTWNQRLAKASLGFLIIGWIGAAALALVNILSVLGIRPKFNGGSDTGGLQAASEL
jgi:uncharacterized membrane protein